MLFASLAASPHSLLCAADRAAPHRLVAWSKGTAIGTKKAKCFQFVYESINSLLSWACLTALLCSASHASTVKFQQQPQMQQQKLECGARKQSAAFGNAFWKRVLCKAAHTHTHTKCSGQVLRISPPFFSLLKQFCFLPNAAVLASWESTFTALLWLQH